MIKKHGKIRVFLLKIIYYIKFQAYKVFSLIHFILK